MPARPAEKIPAPAPTTTRLGIELMRDALAALVAHEGETPLVAELRAYLAVASPVTRGGGS